MRILVTGASGYIGRNLTAELQAAGHETVQVTHRDPLPGQVGLDLDAGTLDVSRLPGGEIGRLDAAVHLAGAPIIGRWTSAHKERIRSSRIAVGAAVARFLAGLDEPPAVYVTGSAVGYYGERGEEILDEDSPPGTGFLSDVCRAWEAAADPARAAGIRVVALRTGIVLGQGGAAGIRVVALRTGIVLGQGGGVLGPQLPIFRLGLGGRLGSGRQWTSWIALEDEVAAIVFSIETPPIEGPVNLVAPEPVRNSEFTAALGRALHRPAPFVVPSAAIRLALGNGPADEMLLVSQRAVPRRLHEHGFAFGHATIDSALDAALGRPPTVSS